MAESIKQGQPIRASTISGIIASGRRARLQTTPPDSPAVAPLRGQLAAGTVSALNTEATAFNRWEIAIMNGSTLQSAPGERSIVIDIEEKGPDNSADNMCIVLDKIEPGEIGKVLAVGITWAQASAGAGALATVEDGQRVLTLGTTGEAKIISGAGNTRVVVMLGGGGGGAGEEPTINWRAVHNEGSS